MSRIKSDAQPLRVVELFAGVGVFRHGLNQVRHAAATHAEDGCAPPAFEVVWANQWEPGNKAQHAASVYAAQWGGTDLVNEDIFAVLKDPAHQARLLKLAPDMLVGGFPCQDYSVAKPLSKSEGLEGKKGVLWWAIHQLLELQAKASQPVKYVMLENVDRLINTPTACRGRDFAIILASLQSLGYAVEWRVINAADYGFAQRRRRIFIQAYHHSTAVGAALLEAAQADTTAQAWLESLGPMAKALPATFKAGAGLHSLAVPAEVWTAQTTYATDRGRSQFATGGLAAAGTVWTAPMVATPQADYSAFTGHAKPLTLGDITADTTEVPAEFFLGADLGKWEFLKGAKRVPRTSKSGHQYEFCEGAVAFPDPLDKPSRTIITAEGNAGPSRTTHVVRHSNGRLRRLTPGELEQLNGLPRGFTAVGGLNARSRAFLMGNALVAGIVTALGRALIRSNLDG